jgi:hypothetical protein
MFPPRRVSITVQDGPGDAALPAGAAGAGAAVGSGCMSAHAVVSMQDGQGDAALPAGAAGAAVAAVHRVYLYTCLGTGWPGRCCAACRGCGCWSCGRSAARRRAAATSSTLLPSCRRCRCPSAVHVLLQNLYIKEEDTGWSAHLLMEVPAAELPDCGPCSTRQRCGGRCECCVATVWPGICASSLQ